MLSSQFILPLAHELVVDLFAGGGGMDPRVDYLLPCPLCQGEQHG